jgi:hypothetical protein
LFIASMIVKMVARLWPAGWWLKYATFLTAFEPQQFILVRDHPAAAWGSNLTLMGLGLACFGLAGVVLTRRDIPVPR